MGSRVHSTCPTMRVQGQDPHPLWQCFPRTANPPVPAPADGATYYANCGAVRAAGAALIHRGDPGDSTKLDRDGDGIGCE
jgi:Excalibur calcium-binding domain